FLDGTFHTYQAHAELVFGHFADAADATVTEMVDIVDGAKAIANFDQGLDHVHDVFTAQHARTGGAFAAETTVELHAANGRQVVAVEREEQVAEQVLGGFFRRRFAGAHHAVDFHQRFHAIRRAVDAQRVGNERTAVQIIG